MSSEAGSPCLAWVYSDIDFTSRIQASKTTSHEWDSIKDYRTTIKSISCLSIPPTSCNSITMCIGYVCAREDCDAPVNAKPRKCSGRKANGECSEVATQHHRTFLCHEHGLNRKAKTQERQQRVVQTEIQERKSLTQERREGSWRQKMNEAQRWLAENQGLTGTLEHKKYRDAIRYNRNQLDKAKSDRGGSHRSRSRSPYPITDTGIRGVTRGIQDLTCTAPDRQPVHAPYPSSYASAVDTPSMREPPGRHLGQPYLDGSYGQSRPDNKPQVTVPGMYDPTLAPSPPPEDLFASTRGLREAERDIDGNVIYPSPPRAPSPHHGSSSRRRHRDERHDEGKSSNGEKRDHSSKKRRH